MRRPGSFKPAPGLLSGSIYRRLFVGALGAACLCVWYSALSMLDGGHTRSTSGASSVALAAAHALKTGLGFGPSVDIAPPVKDLSEMATQAEPQLSEAQKGAERALERLLKEPMEGCPAKWLQTLDEYAQWHREQLTLLAQRSPLAAKVMVYSCAETVDETTVVGDDCGGYADRLTGVTHLFLYSLLFKRVFLIDWSSGGMQVPPHVFHSPYINYTYDESLVIYPGRSVEKRERHFNGCPDHQGPCVLQKDDPGTLFPNDVTLTRINKGGVRYSTDANRARIFSELGLIPDNVGGCLLRALVRPNRETVDAFRQWALRLLDPTVAVVSLHVRTGDQSMHLLQDAPKEFGPSDKYWACALKLRAELHMLASAGGLKKTRAIGAPELDGPQLEVMSAVIFVSVDDIRYKAAAIQAHGNASVWATDVRPWHISKLQLWWDVSTNSLD